MGTQPEEPAVPVRAPSHGTILLWPVWTLDLEWWSACANVATMELNVEGVHLVTTAIQWQMEAAASHATVRVDPITFVIDSLESATHLVTGVTRVMNVTAAHWPYWATWSEWTAAWIG